MSYTSRLLPPEFARWIGLFFAATTTVIALVVTPAAQRDIHQDDTIEQASQTTSGQVVGPLLTSCGRGSSNAKSTVEYTVAGVNYSVAISGCLPSARHQALQRRADVVYAVKAPYFARASANGAITERMSRQTLLTYWGMALIYGVVAWRGFRYPVDR